MRSIWTLCVLVVLFIVAFFVGLRCHPVIDAIKDLLPKVAVAPVTMAIPPGTTLEFKKNKVRIIPGSSKPVLPGTKPTPVPTPREIWHPVELNPWLDKDGVLHVPQSGFCFVPLIGGSWGSGSDFYWEAGARVFVLGQFGLEPSGNNHGWSPKLDYRPFDSNILLGVGPEFKGLTADLWGVSFSAKFDLGLFN